MSALTVIVPVPLWVMLLLIVLLVAWQVLTTLQTKYLRELFDFYRRDEEGAGNG